MMEIGTIHHIGYLVKNIDKSILVFQKLGYSAGEVFFDHERLSRLCFLQHMGTTVELIEPQKDSDIYPLLKKYNNSIYHVCYEVPDIDQSVEQLRKNGFLMFRGKQKAPAISDTAVVVFLMNSRIGIIELVQEGRLDDKIC